MLGAQCPLRRKKKKNAKVDSSPSSVTSAKKNGVFVNWPGVGGLAGRLGHLLLGELTVSKVLATHGILIEKKDLLAE